MQRRLTNFGRFTPIQRSTSLINKFLTFSTFCSFSFLFLLSAFSPLAFAEEKKASPSTLEELLAKGPDPRWSKIVPMPETLGAKTIPPPIIREVQGPAGPHEVKLQNQKAVIFPNIRMHPNPTTTQSEMTIWTHPNNPDVVLAGSNAASNPVALISQGWYYTTNGGTTWLGGDTLPTHTNLGQFMSDPSVGIDLDGNLFFNTLLIGGTHEVVMARSTNNGTNWTQVSLPNASTGNDKNHMTIDVNPGGAFENFLYTAYTDFNVAAPNVMLSRSINRGLSFSVPVPISGSVGAQFGQGVNLAVGPNGEVYGTWSGYDVFPTATTHLGFNKSTNGGSSWGTAVSITDVADIRGTLNKGGNTIRVNSFPSMAVDRSGGARNGWIYIVYPAKNPTTPDVFLVRSTNGGSSWSTPLKVNQDVSSKDQWFSWIACDPATGALYIVYYDSRNFPANDSAQVYVSTSLDGGFTFEDVLISDQAFKPASIPGLAGGYSGDYIGVAAKNGIVWPCWNDNRTGIHQGYTTRAVFIAVGSPPKISVSPDTLDYGNIFLGNPETLTVNIRNLGYPETLHVTNIQSSNTDFTPDVTSFDLPGGNGRGVKVAFNPASAGPSSGTLTILSSDTSNPTVTVALLGTGLIPPDISTAPDSLDADLLTGATKVETLTVSNSGGSDLDFDISVKFSAPLAAALKPLAVKTIDRAASVGSFDAGLSVWEANGFDEATYRQRFPSGPVKNRTEALVSAPMAGANLNAAFSLSAALPLIEDFERLDPWPWSPWVQVFPVSGLISAGCAHDGAQGISDPEWHYRTDVTIGNPGEKLSLWIKPGSGRIYMGFGATAGGAWSLVAGANTNELIIQENAGYGFSPLASVPQVWTFGTWYKLEITFEEGAAVTGRLYASDGTTLLNTVAATLSGFLPGGVAIRSFSGFCGDTFQSGDVLNWLAANPDSGAIPASNSLDVEVTFDATGLNGGDYYANVIVSSNDPDEAQDTTPAHLHVTGAPDIALSDDTLDYGEVFTSGSRTETLVVKDPGTDVVMVSSITSDNPDFTVNISSFNLNPDDSQLVLVTFTPVDTGMFTGNLTILSNDPDEDSLTVYLTGTGILPPDISVSPDSLEADLFTGEMKVETLTIANTGYSDLIFDIAVEDDTILFANAKIINRSRNSSEPPAPAGVRPNLSMLAKEISAEVLTQTSSGGLPFQTLSARSSTSAAPPEVLLLSTIPVLGSVEQALNNLSVAYDLIQTDVFTGIDFSPYTTIIVAMDGGAVEEPDVQALANAASSGKKLIMIGGTSLLPYYNGMQLYLLSHTGQQGWTVSTTPHLQVSDPSHPLAAGLPSPYTFTDPSAAFYMLRVNDALAEVAAINGDGFPDLMNKKIGSGLLIYFLNSPFEFYWSNPTDFAVLQTVIDNALAFSGAPDWLSTNPDSGVIPAGSSAEIEVTFDATGLNGGDYYANILVSSNDPDEPQDTTPAHLHVTGAPDIALSDDSLDYGNVFVGGSRPETLVVSNEGTDLLTVSSISSDNANFTPNPTAFSLNPGDDQNVIVTFTPADSGSFTGQLTIASDDPDEPSLSVYLQGRGLLPPDISVSPESLEADLFTGEMKVETLTIANSGYSDLTFDITIETAALQALKGPNGLPAIRWNPIASRSVTDLPPTTASSQHSAAPKSISRPLVPADFLIIDHFKNKTFFGGYSSVLASEFDLNTLTTADLQQYKVVYCEPDWSDYSNLTNNMSKISAYVQSGGVVVLNVGGNIGDGLGIDPLGTNYANYAGGFGGQTHDAETITDPGHSYITGQPYGGAVLTTADFNSWGATDHGHLFNYPGASHIVLNNTQDASWLEYKLGGGRVIVTTLTYGWGGGGGMGNPLANLVNYSFSVAGGNWLSAAPTSGTIPAGSSLDVEVTFDATGLFGGDYYANILVSSNDPDEPQDTTPAHLHVTGAPDIALSDDSLDYGNLFVGGSRPETLVVSNEGTDLLTVSSISSDNANFTPNPTAFSLNPGQDTNVIVTFAPADSGSFTGQLTIASNDPGDPSLTVYLQGRGLLPPDISVSPESLKAELYSGEMKVETLTISNSGYSDLTFDISIGGVAAAVTSLNARFNLERDNPAFGPQNSISGGMAAQYKPNSVARFYASSGSGNIAVLGADGTGSDLYLNNITQYLVNSGRFASVTTINGYFITPTLAELQAFDAVGVFGWYGWLSSAAIGNVLADYVDAGGNVFIAFAANGTGGGWTVQGRFNTGNYWLISAFSYEGGGAFSLGAVFEPSHPVMNGVSTLISGSKLLNGATVAPGATLLASFTDGTPLAAVKEAGGGRRVDISFPLFTSAVDSWGVNPATDATLLITNAFEWVAGSVDWLSANPASGTVPAGSSLNVEVTFDAVGLDGGYYNANILISSNDPDEPQDTTPVQLHVIGTPNIVLSDDTLDFGTVYINYPDTLTLTVSNDGSDLLEVTGITSNNSHFTLLDPAVFNVPQGGSHNLRVRFSPTQPGVETGALSIASTDSTDPTVTVQLAGLGALPALVQISPDSFKVTLPMGDSTTRTLTIGNTGLGNLNWQIIGLPSYLSVAPAAGVVAPGNTQDVTVKISAKSLPAGTYQTSIRTAANDPTTPLVLTPLRLTVINCTAFKGDINDDGLLTPADVVRELNCIFLSIFGCELCFADMNCDGRLTAADAVILMNTVFLGLPPGC